VGDGLVAAGERGRSGAVGFRGAAGAMLGRGWRPSFQPSRIEAALVVIGLLVFFGAVVLPAVPWAPLKLLPLLVVTLGALYVNSAASRPAPCWTI